MPDSPSTVSVLSIDGGGIRGLVPARLLAFVEEQTGRPISALFDLIAGTSTGGLLALGLTRPERRGSEKPRFSAEELAQLYLDEGPSIFSRSRWRSIRTGDALFGVKYSDTELNRVLKTYLGASRLKDALAPVLVTAYELEGRSAFFFKSHRAKTESQRDFPMWEAARATAAAPTYFKPLLIERADYSTPLSLIDGGVFANNPAMSAFAEARSLYPEAERILLVSMGTGQLTEPLPHSRTKNWGKIGWAQPILDVVFHGISDAVDYQMHRVLAEGRGSYFRFQTRLTHVSDDFDDASAQNLAALDQLADRLIRERRSELAQLSDELVALRSPHA